MPLRPDAYLDQAVYDAARNIVRGYVYGDIKARFNDGDLIRTSNVQATTEDGYVKTLNSVYRIINWKEAL